MKATNAIFEEALDIINSRANYYRKSAASKSEDFYRASAYESCASMLEYALKGDWDCLTQFSKYDD